MYKCTYQGGYKIYSIYDNDMEVSGSWLFMKLVEYGCKIGAYTSIDNSIVLYGDFPRREIIKIKKFFHDNYPFVEHIEPSKYKLTIYFKTKVRFVLDTFNPN